jgi:hypothetical protein
MQNYLLILITFQVNIIITLKDERARFHVQTKPEGRILLLSETEAHVEIFITVDIPGDFSITVPLQPSCTYAHVDDLTVIVRMTGPRFRFDTPQIDFGLIGAGGMKMKTLNFTNEGDVPAMFFFRSILDADKEGVTISNVTPAAPRLKRSSLNSESSANSRSNSRSNSIVGPPGRSSR